MTNPYYNHTTFPATGSAGSSSLMRAELQAISDGFDKLPTLAGNGNYLVAVNSAGDALTASPILFVAPGSSTLRFSSGTGGIQFDNSTRPGLNYYDVDTFTPEIADAASGGNVGAASTIDGWFMRVGQQVTVTVRVQGINTTGLTGSNNLFVRNLPFTAAAKTGTFYYLGSCRVENTTFSGSLSAVVLDGAAHLRISQSPSGASTSATQLNVSAFTSGTANLWAQVTYEAA